ncbi:MAG TPA: hypothetical protein PLV45_10690 [bacterium]|nr:hypothetical protein [bacterium]
MDTQRHGCLTAWLIWMIIANLFVIFLHVIGRVADASLYGDASAWALPAMLGLAFVNIVCVIGLFYWKKWAFWGLCASALAAFAVNLNLGVLPAIPGLLGPVILFAVLKIGRPGGWDQLE